MKLLLILALSACTYNGKSGAERQRNFEEERQQERARSVNRVNPSPGVPSTEQAQPF